MRGLEHLFYGETVGARGLFSLEKTEGDLINAHKHHKGGFTEDGATLFSEVPNDRNRSNGHKLKH